MTVTSTRRVSASYNTSVKGGYEVARGRQSFVETIDTTNNVSVTDDTDSGGRKYFSRSQDEEQQSFDSQSTSVSQEALSDTVQGSRHLSPLLDNDDSESSVFQNRSVGIYGNNQAISSSGDDRADNPYLRHLYESNEIIEDIDELI